MDGLLLFYHHSSSIKKNIYPSKIVIFHSYVSLPRGNPLKSLDFSIPNATQVAHLAPGVSPGLLRSRPRHRWSTPPGVPQIVWIRADILDECLSQPASLLTILTWLLSSSAMPFQPSQRSSLEHLPSARSSHGFHCLEGVEPRVAFQVPAHV